MVEAEETPLPLRVGCIEGMQDNPLFFVEDGAGRSPDTHERGEDQRSTTVQSDSATTWLKKGLVVIAEDSTSHPPRCNLTFRA